MATTRRRRLPNDEYPVLSPKEDQTQRGEDPPGSFGHVDRPSGDLKDGWRPSTVGRQAGRLIKEIGRERRPRREDVYPYLMIRAFSPGDRGARPIWPPVPCWESPDIALIDAAWTGPFDPSRLVVNPTSGRRYRVFVRIWNLGLLPAIGVHVRAWFVNPGFFGGDPNNPAYQPQLIGGAMVNLTDRTRPGASAVVELDHTWDIPSTLTGHECLMATVSCPLDQWSGALDANHDRHVGQRNLTILAGADDTSELFQIFGGLLTRHSTMQLMHGGAAVTPLLRGVLGTTKGEFGPASRLRAPSAKAYRLGIATGHGRHLLTMLRVKQGWLVADSARLWKVAVDRGLVDEQVHKGEHPFDTPLGARELIERLGPEFYDAIGVIIDGPGDGALAKGVAALWNLPGMRAADLAAAIAGEGRGAHLLRLTHVDGERQESGGYSVAIVI
jgi:hypothetical protein